MGRLRSLLVGRGSYYTTEHTSTRDSLNYLSLFQSQHLNHSVQEVETSLIGIKERPVFQQTLSIYKH